MCCICLALFEEETFASEMHDNQDKSLPNLQRHSKVFEKILFVFDESPLDVCANTEIIFTGSLKEYFSFR